MNRNMLAAYRRFFGVHRWLANHIKNAALMLDLISRIGPWFNPAKRQEGYPMPGEIARWPQDRKRWKNHQADVSVGTALLYRMRDFPSLMDVQWNDPSGALQTAKMQGGLILTYHHPFAYQFAALVACTGVRLDVIALSPEESPLYPLFHSHGIDKWFSESEAFLGGGEWIFLRRGQPNSNLLRIPLRALKKGTAVVSVHDFQNFYSGSRSLPATLLGKTIEAPVGMIEPALRAGLPICVGYMNWLGGREFEVTLVALNGNGTEKISEQEVLFRYFSHLETLLAKSPEFWEGWGMLE